MVAAPRIIHLVMELLELPATMVAVLHITLQVMELQEVHQIMVGVQVILPSVMVIQGVQVIMVGVQLLMTMIRFPALPAIMVETLHTIQSRPKRSLQVSGIINRFNN